MNFKTFLNLGGPAGGLGHRKVATPQRVIVYDSESLSGSASLESNMGAQEIMKFVLRDYSYFSHHKSDHNSFLTHRILLRMEVNHPEVCNLVVSKAQLLAIPLAKDLSLIHI